MSEVLISIIGAGRVGSTLAVALAQAGYRLMAVVDPDIGLASAVREKAGARLAADTLVDEIKSSSIVIISVPDDIITAVAESLFHSGYTVPGQLVAHTSGFHPAAILQPVKKNGALVGSLHPLASIAQRFSALPPKPYFGLEGEAEAVLRLRSLAQGCGWSTVELEPSQKALYHAACVLATGMNAALWGISQELFRHLGFGDDSLGMVRSLAASLTSNVLRSEIAEALTGPLVRGQAGVVAEHLQALENVDPEAVSAYRTLGLAMLRRLVKDLDNEAREKMERILRTSEKLSHD